MNRVIWVLTCMSIAVTGTAAMAAVDPPFPVPAGGNGYLSFSGTATSLPSNRFLYRENHVLHYQDGRLDTRVVLYTCRDGTAFARKTVSHAESLSPDFILEDASNGMREGIRTDGNARRVFFRADGGSPEKSNPLPDVRGLVADSGFDLFVRTNWQALMTGQSLGMKFLVPSRLEDIDFKVRHLRGGEAGGVPVEVFRLKLSGVLGWVAPYIDVYYGARDKTLIRYVGLSDLQDASHDNFQADIDFKPGDRRTADEKGMADARSARLAPCNSLR